eukprot:415284_1
MQLLTEEHEINKNIFGKSMESLIEMQNSMDSLSAQSKLLINDQNNEIYEFFKSGGLHQYAQVFINNGFDSMLSLRVVKENDLRDLGITKIGHRRQIFHFVRNLNLKQHQRKQKTKRKG